MDKITKINAFKNPELVDPEKYYCVKCGDEMTEDQDECLHEGHDLIAERHAAIDELIAEMQRLGLYER